MKKYLVNVLLFSLLSLFAFAQSNNLSIDLYSQLHDLENIKFGENSIELFYNQPIDHKNPKSETFEQRVILNHVSYDKPVVVILEGYGIYTEKRDELSKLLDANQIIIEHRFFNNSRPDSIPWDKLDIWQAATDQHNIIQEFKKIYKGKFISTGISKGGQTTMYHRYFYPNDVSVSVPYVAPLNLDREDERIHEHLKTIGEKSTRDKILAFQKLCFERKSELLPYYEEYAKDWNYEFEMGLVRAFDLSVLEYSFAFWQWGENVEDIPSDEATDREISKHLMRVSPPSFFDKYDTKATLPFYYQALTEMGMYSYEIDSFNEYLDDTTDITFDFVKLPKWEITFDTDIMKRVNNWIQTDAEKLLFIYGEYDTWSATAVDLNGNTKCKKFVNPKGSHSTRINSFPDEMKNEIIETLNNWLSED